MGSVSEMERDFTCQSGILFPVTTFTGDPNLFPLEHRPKPEPVILRPLRVERAGAGVLRHRRGVVGGLRVRVWGDVQEEIGRGRRLKVV